jgi:HD-GYP domain-containing protein (c-di-GMP phosphodiesterase class II)
MEARDPRLRRHGIRTSQYAVMLGEAYGLSPGKLRDLHFAGLLHDIGQLTLPEALRCKEGPLTSEEYVQVQCHPRAGAELLVSFAFLQRAALWIAHHHERWDGTGYPYGLRGRFIPLGARMLAVADTFDAIVASDSRQRERATDAALRILEVVAGSQLDPDLVNSFAARILDQGMDRHMNVAQDKPTEVIEA